MVMIRVVMWRHWWVNDLLCQRSEFSKHSQRGFEFIFKLQKKKRPCGEEQFHFCYNASPTERKPKTNYVLQHQEDVQEEKGADVLRLDCWCPTVFLVTKAKWSSEQDCTVDGVGVDTAEKLKRKDKGKKRKGRHIWLKTLGPWTSGGGMFNVEGSSPVGGASVAEFGL